MKRVSTDGLSEFHALLKASNTPTPRAAVKCLFAKTHRRNGRLCLRIEYIDGLDRFLEGQVFVVCGRSEKAVRFISTVMAHGDPDPSNWFTVMHVEPIHCTCDDLVNVFLISDDAKA